MILRLLLIGLWICPALLHAQEIERRLILIGDAGEINTKQEMLIPAAAELVLPDKTMAYFLGDNIYPTGMGLDDSNRLQSAAILRSQFEPFRERGVPVYFMAGNHDWDKSGPDGLAKIKAQEAYIHRLGDSNLRFVPSAGNLGPFVELLTDSVVTVIYDSEFWLFPYHDTVQSADLSQQKKQFLANLANIAEEHSEKQLLVMSHHPMRSYGEHSLRFSVTDHIFPLRKVWKGLYIPLPVVGSIYPLLRSTVFRTAEDVKHPHYRELIESVTDALGNHPRVIYVSGHDHGLQLIQDDTFTQVVSGSGAKTSNIRMASDLRYRFGQQGFTVMDFLTNGEMKVIFYIVDNAQVRKDFEASLVDGKVVH
jgi:tartrate-resistant acid phosphatase type 5